MVHAHNSTPAARSIWVSTRGVVGPFIIPLLAFLVGVSAFWLPTTRFGISSSYFFFTPLIALILVVAIPVSLGYALYGHKRAKWYAFSMLWGLVAIFVGLKLGQEWRMDAFHALAERSATLVDAIKRFEKQKGRPPDKLDELVPQFLPSVPSTGMGGYPQYNYLVGEEAKEYGGNYWAIEVFTPGPGINFDCFLYYPDQDYPETGFSGSLERIGTWAYVHE